MCLSTEHPNMNTMERPHGSSSSLHSFPSSSQQSTPVASPPGSPLRCKPDLIYDLPSLSSSSSDDLSLDSSDSMINSKSTGEILVEKPHRLIDFLTTSSPALHIAYSVAVLVGIPFFVYNGAPEETVSGNLATIQNVWDGLLRMSSVPITLIILVASIYFAPCCLSRCGCNNEGEGNEGCAGSEDRWTRRLSKLTGASPDKTRSRMKKVRSFLSTPDGFGVALAFVIGLPINTTSSFPVIFPGWGWCPGGWFTYKTYPTEGMSTALEGLCLDQDLREIRLPRKGWAPSLGFRTVSDADRRHLPLCLAEDQWDFLSAGALSSTNKKDVRSVLKGIKYAQGDKSGLAIAVLARDIVEHLQNLRDNVEALAPFFRNLSLVIFENDSTDGSREAIKKWAAEAASTDLGYSIDLMECAEAKDCKLGKLHRDKPHHGDYAHTSAVGDMDTYRQRVTDHITQSPMYADYSHMMVIDIDVAVSVSPFGVLHSLGEHPENSVASSGRQMWPGTWGTLAVPYDFSAFRPWALETNHWVLSWHETWCSIMPEGDRWRNACDAVSPFLMAEVLRSDRGTSNSSDFYQVESAFNGAVLYPLDQVRVSQATYDKGEDGQRCEHIGFNLAMTKEMFVNRRWDLHLSPSNPGGPTGWRAQNIVSHFTTTPKILFWLIVVQLVSYIIYVHAISLLGFYMVYPIMEPLLEQGKSLQRLLTTHGRKQRRIWNGKHTDDTLFKMV